VPHTIRFLQRKRYFLAQLAIGVLVMTGEYATGSIRDDIASMRPLIGRT
jgi:hypothetical protein